LQKTKHSLTLLVNQQVIGDNPKAANIRMEWIKKKERPTIAAANPILGGNGKRSCLIGKRSWLRWG